MIEEDTWINLLPLHTHVHMNTCLHIKSVTEISPSWLSFRFINLPSLHFIVNLFQIFAFYDLERWLRVWEYVLLLQRTQVWFPAPMSGSSHLPKNCSKNVISLWPKRVPMFTCTYSHTDRHHMYA